MNRMTRGLGLLLLGVTTACVNEIGPPPADEPSADQGADVPGVAGSSAPGRNAAVFNSRIRDRLAARGIEVYGGSQATPTREPEPERTTVELPWKVPGYPMSRLDDIDPEWVPAQYATQLGIRWPKAATRGGHAYVDPSKKWDKGSCSGTQVASYAVLTAAHCVIDYREYGRKKVGKARDKALMKAYSMTSRPRRNGGGSIARGAPQGAQKVKNRFWRKGNWPGGDKNVYESDHDFAILKLESQPFIHTAPLRSVESPQGVFFETVHYPFPFERGFRMYYSVGDIENQYCADEGGVFICYLNVYSHRISIEPGSSGAGLFEFGVDGVAGIIISEDNGYDPDKRRPGQTRKGFPNQALMLTPTINMQLSLWINEI